MGASASIAEHQVEAFERVIAAGGVCLFPSDTVYGLGCDPSSEQGVRRLYEIKRRPLDQPAAVMFFSLERALDCVSYLGPRTLSALERLLPGAVTVLVENPRGLYPLACGSSPNRLGLRVPALAGMLTPLGGVESAVLQSSANQSGRAEARRLDEVDAVLRRSVDFELDGGELSGTASTVVDLTRYEQKRSYAIARFGAVSREVIDRSL